MLIRKPIRDMKTKTEMERENPSNTMVQGVSGSGADETRTRGLRRDRLEPGHSAEAYPVIPAKLTLLSHPINVGAQMQC